MIKSVTVTNYLGDSIKLELTRPEKSGFIVRSITGLGPGKSNINTTEVSTNDGALYNSARVPSRNIVISLTFVDNGTIEDIRQLSYKYFPLKRKVKLLIETDNRTSEIEGYVESNEPDIFSQEEGSDISIICPDPFFYSAYETQRTSFAGIEPMFEFPFSNESLTEGLIEFSVIRNQIDRDIIYSGDFEVGLTIHIRAYGDASGITLYNLTSHKTMFINTDVLETITGSGLSNGDEIVISTVKNNKSVTLIRNGKFINILNCISKDSTWFEISKGTNKFAYDSKSGRENIQVEIENRILYEGI